MNAWIPVEHRKPEVCIPVLGFSEKWKHEDFNPKGVRECFLMDDGLWLSAVWNNEQDCWDTHAHAPPYQPTHWQEIPYPPCGLLNISGSGLEEALRAANEAMIYQEQLSRNEANRLRAELAALRSSIANRKS